MIRPFNTQRTRQNGDQNEKASYLKKSQEIDFSSFQKDYFFAKWESGDFHRKRKRVRGAEERRTLKRKNNWTEGKAVFPKKEGARPSFSLNLPYYFYFSPILFSHTISSFVVDKRSIVETRRFSLYFFFSVSRSPIIYSVSKECLHRTTITVEGRRSLWFFSDAQNKIDQLFERQSIFS